MGAELASRSASNMTYSRLSGEVGGGLVLCCVLMVQ